MIFKNLGLFFKGLGFFFALFLGACSHKPNYQKDIEGCSDKKPLLFEITKEKKISYLFGTIHRGISLNELAPIVTVKAQESDVLVIEADVEGLQKDRRAFFQDKDLSQMLNPKAWKIFTQAFAGKTPEKELKRLKPWAAAIFYANAEVDKVSKNPEGFLEDDLIENFRARKKNIRALESVNDQLDALEFLIGPKELEENLLSGKASDGDFDLARQAYQCGDEKILGKIFEDEMSSREREVLLEKRNRKWVPQIEELMKKSDIFVAVGAGHLAGPVGLLKLLERDGFRVKRIEGAW